MSTPELIKNIEQLRNKVGKIDNESSPIKINKNMIYITAPIIMLILLAVFTPKFLKSENKQKKW